MFAERQGEGQVSMQVYINDAYKLIWNDDFNIEKAQSEKESTSKGLLHKFK